MLRQMDQKCPEAASCYISRVLVLWSGVFLTNFPNAAAISAINKLTRSPFAGPDVASSRHVVVQVGLVSRHPHVPMFYLSTSDAQLYKSTHWISLHFICVVPPRALC